MCIFWVSGWQPKEQIVHKDLSADLPTDNNLHNDKPQLTEATANLPAKNSAIGADNHLVSAELTALSWYAAQYICLFVILDFII